MNFLQDLNRFPPYLLRIAATRSGGKVWRSTRDIARDSGLSIQTVAEISEMTSWDRLPAKTIVKFIAGCGLSLDDRRGRQKIVQKFTKTRMVYSRSLTSTQRDLFSRLLALAKAQ